MLRRLINSGVMHRKSPSRLRECEQGILPGPSGWSSPNGIHTGIIRNLICLGLHFSEKHSALLAIGSLGDRPRGLTHHADPEPYVTTEANQQGPLADLVPFSGMMDAFPLATV